MIYKSYADISNDIIEWCSRLPKFAAVCGIPRAGTIIASMISSHRNIHLVEFSDLVNNKKTWENSLRRNCPGIISTKELPILVIDDTTWSGERLQEVKQQIPKDLSVKYAAYIAASPGIDSLDYYFHDCDKIDHLFQFNILHHWFNEKTLCDIDGVLCEDWRETSDEGDMLEKYIKHLDNARCLINPTFPLMGLVTARLQKYQSNTEQWLAKHNIKYEKLHMSPHETSLERHLKDGFVGHKSNIYKNSDAILFVESCPTQAPLICDRSGKDVLSWKEQKLYKGRGKVWSSGGDVGDTLYSLATVKQLGGGTLNLHHANVRESYNPQKADKLIRLLDKQPYLVKSKYSERAEGINLEEWRGKYKNHLCIADMVAEAFGTHHYPRNEPWLFCDDPITVADVVVHRSDRYRGPFNWKGIIEKYEGNWVFVGMPDEHRDWERQFAKIPYYPTSDWWELARVISGAKVFVGNQSGPMALALGLGMGIRGTAVIQEQSTYCPNCHIQRPGCFYGDCEVPSLDIIPGLGNTLITMNRLEVIARLVKETSTLPGVMVECGSAAGGSAAIISHCCPHKILYVFDSLGLPEDDIDGGHHKKGEFGSGERELRDFLRPYNIDINIGIFPATAKDFDHKVSFCHLDFDLYVSTIAALKFFKDKMLEGGVMVLDDFESPACPGVVRALREVDLLDRVEKTAPLQGVIRF